MPNHVHLLITPVLSLPKLTKSLKGITARRGNEMLALTGASFWQEEIYDHTIRNRSEFETISRYIEHNPVRAGFVTEAHAFRWSSATRGSPGPGHPARSGAFAVLFDEKAPLPRSRGSVAKFFRTSLPPL
jgi:hypothetical protein